MLSYVLIIDKRKELSTKYKKSLEDNETAAVISRNLKDALRLIQTTDPDVIIVSDSIDENLADFCKKMSSKTKKSFPYALLL